MATLDDISVPVGAPQTAGAPLDLDAISTPVAKVGAPSAAPPSKLQPGFLSDDPRDWAPMQQGERRGVFVPLVEKPGQAPELGMPGVLHDPYAGAEHILKRGPAHPSELTDEDIKAGLAAGSAAIPKGFVSRNGVTLEGINAAHAAETAATRALGPRIGPSGLEQWIDPATGELNLNIRRPQSAPELANLSPGALQRLTRAIRDDRLTGPDAAGATAEFAGLGPQGVIADLGPNVRGQVDALANMPNPGQRTVVDRLVARDEGARGRIEDATTASFGPRQDVSAQIRQLEAQRGTPEQAIEQTFGPRTNVADRMRALEAERRAGADPLYEAFRNTKVTPTPELKRLTDTLERRGLFSGAETLMPLEQKQVMQKFFTSGKRKDYPTAEAWTYVDQAISGRIREAARTGNNNEARVYTILQQRLRAALEAHPNAGNIYRSAREAYAEPSGVMDAVRSGQEVWGRTSRVDDLRYELQTYNQHEREGFLEGARDSLSQMLDASIRGDEHTQALLMSQAAQDKMRAMGVNPDRVNEVLHNLPGRVSDALQRGREIWSRQVRASELRHEVGQLSPPERAAFIEGARDEIARLMDATRNGDTQARNLLLSPMGQEKAAVLGQNADDLIRVLQTEADRKGMHNSVLANSRTQGRAAAQKEFDSRVGPTPNYTGVTVTGALVQGIRKAIDFFRQAAENRKIARVGTEVADVLTRPADQGGTELLSALQREAERPTQNALKRGADRLSGIAAVGGHLSGTEASGTAVLAPKLLKNAMEPQLREGATATNEQTGERLRFDGKAWQKIRKTR